MLHSLGDNYQVNVIASGIDAFESAMSLAFNGRQAEYYGVFPQPFGMVFFWYVSTHDFTQSFTLKKDTDGVPFICEPLEFNRLGKAYCVGDALEPAWDWLNKKANYPCKPYGNNVEYYKGFQITTGDQWGHIGGHQGTICMIRAEWLGIKPLKTFTRLC